MAHFKGLAVHADVGSYLRWASADVEDGMSVGVDAIIEPLSPESSFVWVVRPELRLGALEHSDFPQATLGVLGGVEYRPALRQELSPRLGLLGLARTTVNNGNVQAGLQGLAGFLSFLSASLYVEAGLQSETRSPFFGAGIVGGFF